MTRLALLWHMHQPNYVDPATGVPVLPWVRLHAIKDYRGMVDMLGAYPRVRATFNLVPSLLAQIERAVGGGARDRLYAVGLADAAGLGSDDRAFLVAHGFHAPHHRMIAPYPRYAELHEQRHLDATDWTLEALRDLQVWHRLAWMDPDWLVGDDRLRRLVDQGRDFTEGDKQALASVEEELLATTIPAYRKAQDRGQVELATSPYYHPILPLLCDTDAHLVSFPDALVPEPPFRWPDDAREQVARAVRAHEGWFGRPPLGLWPSEGAVSNLMVPIVAAAGFQWMASDEDILARSLGVELARDADGLLLRPEVLYRPYELQAGGRRLRMLFRDHALSDRIGFTYQSWDPRHAADDFLWRVGESGRRFSARTGGEDATIAVILDGENAWEYYAGGGRAFLREVYRRLQDAPDIEAVTMAKAVTGPAAALLHLHAGSWIHANFHIWAGHADDRRAWSQLSRARATFDARSPMVGEASRTRAFEALLAAEGSDWFWWYGDDHSSGQDDVFDALFRAQLRQVYEALGMPAPAELHRSNRSVSAAPGAGGSMESVTDVSGGSDL